LESTTVPPPAAGTTEVPEIRLSLTERLNNYFEWKTSRDNSFVSTSIPNLQSSIEAKPKPSNTNLIPPKVHRKVSQQTQQPQKRQQPPQEIDDSLDNMQFIRKIVDENTVKVRDSKPLKQSTIPSSNPMLRLLNQKPRYNDYNSSDDESNDHLFMKEKYREPEFGVINTILKAKEVTQETNRKKQLEQQKLQAAQALKAATKSTSYPSPVSEAKEFFAPTAMDGQEPIDIASLKEQIKQEIYQDLLGAQAKDEEWDRKLEETLEQIRKPFPPTMSTPNSSNITSHKTKDGNALRLQMMQELERQEEIFNYALELQDIQNSLQQPMQLPLIVQPKVEPPPQQSSPEISSSSKKLLKKKKKKNTVPEQKSDEFNNGLASTALALLAEAQENLSSTEKTIEDSEKLLNLYRTIQEQQSLQMNQQSEQQSVAMMKNLNALPLLNELERQIDQLQMESRPQRLASHTQVPLHISDASTAMSPHRHYDNDHHTNYNNRFFHETAAQTSPYKVPSSPYHPPSSSSSSYPHSAYPRQQDGHSSAWRGPLTENVSKTYIQALQYDMHPEGLSRLEKLEQKQRERMEWLDEIIRLHLSTPNEIANEREKIYDLHRRELQTLRDNLRESRGGELHALSSSTTNEKKGFKAPEEQPDDYDDNHFSLNVMNRILQSNVEAGRKAGDHIFPTFSPPNQQQQQQQQQQSNHTSYKDPQEEDEKDPSHQWKDDHHHDHGDNMRWLDNDQEEAADMRNHIQSYPLKDHHHHHHSDNDQPLQQDDEIDDNNNHNNNNHHHHPDDFDTNDEDKEYRPYGFQPATNQSGKFHSTILSLQYSISDMLCKPFSSL
jgi:hypothetical protein